MPFRHVSFFGVGVGLSEFAEVLSGGLVGGGLAFCGLGEVGAEVLLGACELGGEILGEDEVSGLVEGAEVVGDGGA